MVARTHVVPAGGVMPRVATVPCLRPQNTIPRRAFYASRGVRLLPDPDQDSTDLHKCLAHARTHLAAVPARRLHLVVLGAFGGRLDHTVQNLATLYDLGDTFDGGAVLLSEDCVAALLPPGECDKGGGDSFTRGRHSRRRGRQRTRATLVARRTPPITQGAPSSASPCRSRGRRAACCHSASRCVWRRRLGHPTLRTCGSHCMPLVVSPRHLQAVITTRGLKWDVADWATHIGTHVRR